MESEQTRLKQIVALLEAVVQGSLDPHAAITRWPQIDHETNELIKNVWHQLYHYFIDTDIREREPEYGESQREHLSMRIKDLKALLEE